MPPKLNPYSELGVPLDATKAEVRRAYRRKAKRAHPDAGGSAEDFQRLTKCAVVLLDKEKRERFDATGTVDEVEPDNRMSLPLTFLAGAIAACVADAVSKREEPGSVDFLRGVKTRLSRQIAETRKQLDEIEYQKEFLLRISKRVSSKKDNRVVALMASQIRSLENSEVALRTSSAAMADAVKIVDDHSFDVDRAAAAHVGYIGQWRFRAAF